MTQSVWDSVVGQVKAVEQLHQLAINNVHAYLFVGPEGCGKDEAARAFAAQLITGSDNATSREANLIMRGSFSDVIEVLREGAAVDKDDQFWPVALDRPVIKALQFINIEHATIALISK